VFFENVIAILFLLPPLGCLSPQLAVVFGWKVIFFHAPDSMQFCAIAAVGANQENN
jgi:hypothetical protein